jgi:predicted O-methyltransferase YrrM
MVDDGTARFAKGMRPGEYEVLEELLERYRPKRTLEIGLANGGSAVMFCKHHARQHEGGTHTAIDPYQTVAPPLGFAGAAVQAVREVGCEGLFRLIEEPNFTGLPRLVVEKAKFDLVLIDGWHSFDYAFVDYFYADLLLEPGGVMIFHDTGWPSVERVCRFLEANKPYDRLSPPTAVELRSFARRLARRVGQLVTGTMASARERRTRWHSLAAYRKRADHMVHESDYRAF